MKNLFKISRNIGLSFCWQERPRNDSEEVINNTEALDKAKEDLNNDEKITRALSAIEAGATKMPSGFESISASVFLQRNPEELQRLFIIDGFVDFRGNSLAQREIGLTDIFPKISVKQQFVIIDGVNYIYGARRSDGKIGYGNPKYKAITGGERIQFFVAEAKSQSFVTTNEGKLQNPPEYENFAGFNVEYLANMENITPETETEEKNYFIVNIENNPKNLINNNESVVLSERQSLAISFFVQKGYSQEQSSGIVGNLMAESNLSTSAVGDGGRAFGIAQWHPDRQQIFLRTYGKSIRTASFSEQLAFIYFELQTTESSANSRLKKAKTAAEAAVVVDKYYERSSGQHLNKRIAYASKLQNSYDNIA